MNVVRGEVEKERLLLFAFDKGQCLSGEHVRHVLVLPQRRLTSFHETDAANTVNDRLIVPVRPIERERGAIFHARRFAGVGFLVTHGNGIVRPQPDHAVIFHIHARHAVTSGGHNERVIKADLKGTRFDLTIPI